MDQLYLHLKIKIDSELKQNTKYEPKIMFCFVTLILHDLRGRQLHFKDSHFRQSLLLGCYLWSLSYEIHLLVPITILCQSFIQVVCVVRVLWFPQLIKLQLAT